METRKDIRLKEFDYSQNGAYFITICTRNRETLFWKSKNKNTFANNDNVGAGIARPQDTYELSDIGKIAELGIINIPKVYRVNLDKYVVMPNHIHILLSVTDNDGRTMHAPTNNIEQRKTSSVSNIIQQYKGYVTKKAGFPVWQKSFYDHIVRNEEDYLNIWEYIETNPLKWSLDKYYKED